MYCLKCTTDRACSVDVVGPGAAHLLPGLVPGRGVGAAQALSCKKTQKNHEEGPKFGSRRHVAPESPRLILLLPSPAPKNVGCFFPWIDVLPFGLFRHNCCARGQKRVYIAVGDMGSYFVFSQYTSKKRSLQFL